MRTLFLILCFSAGCAPGPLDSLPEVLEYAWLKCVFVPETGQLVDPNCVPGDRAILHLSIPLRDDGRTVDIVSDAPGIFVARQDQIEALSYPETGAWLDHAQAGEEWGELSGDIAGDPSSSLFGLTAIEEGQTLAFIVIDAPPRDDSGRALESTVTLSSDGSQHTITLRPIVGGK